MFADMLVPDPEDLKSYVLQGHRQVLQLPGATGPKALPHWPTSHFFQLKIGTIWDATVATYEVPSTPQGLGPAPGVPESAPDRKQALGQHRKPMLMCFKDGTKKDVHQKCCFRHLFDCHGE